jgi:conjugative relaxase-like TrwC/TraI family protein
MLTPAVVRSAAGAASYYATDNYYTDGQATEASLWVGQGAAELGLEGKVGQQAFEAVLAGRLPGGDTIAAGANGKHRAGLDFTFSAPKSLSLLAYVGGDVRLLDAHMAAVRATIGWMEANLAETRVSRDGRQEAVRSGNLVVALFQHDTSRALDPQAHIHAIIANATKAPDGSWHALHNDALWQGYTAAASVYNATLRAAVEQLGYATERVAKHGQFEIAGIPRDTIELFSTRAAEIDAGMAAMTHRTPEARSAVTLSTRAAKPAELDRDVLRGEWAERARGAGVDLPAMVAMAQARAVSSPTTWQRLVAGAGGIAAQGIVLAEKLGIRIGPAPDPLVPERAGRLRPDAFVAAHAVASAIRHLGEREAAFPARDVLKAALDLGVPVAVTAVEQRIALLATRGLLIADNDGLMMTTDQALAIERNIVAGVRAGRDAVPAIIAAGDAGALIQQAAVAAMNRRLNTGQLAAATTILTARDRVVAVQGVAGAGKSSMLKPVVAIAKAEGRQVIGLAIQNSVARRLGADTGVAARTITSFLREHEYRPGTSLRGAMLVVDEASMIDNRTMERLVDVAQAHGVGRLVLVGDRKQLGAVQAGKPFDVILRAGSRTAVMDENVRATTPAMRAIHAAAQGGNVPELMQLLKPNTIEAPGTAAAVVAARWLALSPADRARTGIYASGRQLRGEINDEIQRRRLAAGELTGTAARFEVLSPVHLTREEQRAPEHYLRDRVVEFSRGVPTQGIRPGFAVVVGVTGPVVTLRRPGGRQEQFRPGKLAANRVDDFVRVYERQGITLYAGDPLRWTATDHDRGLVNADTARLTRVVPDALTVATADGRELRLERGDPMLKRLDLAYATSTHAAQGATSDLGIVAADSREGKLITTSLLRVLATRMREGVTLVVDDGQRLEKVASRQSGEKTAASDVVGRTTVAVAPAGEARIQLPDPRTAEMVAIRNYARAFIAVETAHQRREWPERDDLRAMHAGADRLDQLRPNGAEDIRIVLDRRPELGSDLASGRIEPAWRAWIDEGQARAGSGADYAARFVADWRAASAEVAAASGEDAGGRAERKLERLAERMDQQPRLARVLEQQIPERQLEIDRLGMTRTRDMGMGL